MSSNVCTNTNKHVHIKQPLGACAPPGQFCSKETSCQGNCRCWYLWYMPSTVLDTYDMVQLMLGAGSCSLLMRWLLVFRV